jgi:uncharacterized membrane protein YeaQ/YmgE (transglycosylase-associated protein family)
MGILWIILIRFIAGIIARLLAPGPNKPSEFILTTVLGIAGAFLATFIGQLIGWYRPDQGAGFIGATVGAVIVLFCVEQACRGARDLRSELVTLSTNLRLRRVFEAQDELGR